MSDDAAQFGDEVDRDPKQMKAQRAWMLQVNNILHQNGMIDSDERQDLHDLTMKATGWDDE